jgi:AAA+ superfamily predicted ATPase
MPTFPFRRRPTEIRGRANRFGEEIPPADEPILLPPSTDAPAGIPPHAVAADLPEDQEPPLEDASRGLFGGRPEPRYDADAEAAEIVGYASSDEQLWEALRRIDQLVRGQTVRWLRTVGHEKPEHLWGMVHVSDAEVEAYLRSEFTVPGELPDHLGRAVMGYWQAAARMAEISAAREAATAPGIRLRLKHVQHTFGLTNLERDILLVCLLPELDDRYRRLFGYLQDDASRTRPSAELVWQILYPEAPTPAAGRAVFAAQAPLMRRRLLAPGADVQGDEPLPGRALRVDDRIAAYLLGDDRPDGRLERILWQPVDPPGWDDLIITPERLERLQRLAAWHRQRRDEVRGGMTLFFHGPYGSGRLAAARAIAADSDTPLLVADIHALLAAAYPAGQTIDLCYREAMLADAALYWAGCEALIDNEQAAAVWDHLLAAAEAYPGLTFLAAHTAWDPAGRFHTRPFLRVDFPTPNYELRRRLWEAHLPPAEDFASPPPDRDHLTSLLANSFQLTEGQIVDANVTARELAGQRDPLAPRLTTDDLHEGCRRQSGRRLITFARRIEPRTEMTFSNLVLPAANQRQLEELRQRIQHRSLVFTGLGFERRLTLGQGLIALFTGSSGTGKTMAAELLAREHGVDLYKVDLSAVVSKYVGETEKNLSRVFAEAEDSNAIIFFDEADALFGKRGEVKEARDRWANIEVNYLLQRVEEYAGVVILATNLRQNIDEAFMRRIHVIVEFPFPEVDARRQIWLGMFPSGDTVNRPSDADIAALAQRFRLAGGSIRNIVLDATFRAVAADPSASKPTITLRHLVDSTAREYQKLGKPITKGEFGEQFYAWVAADILLSTDPNAAPRNQTAAEARA